MAKCLCLHPCQVLRESVDEPNPPIRSRSDHGVANRLECHLKVFALCRETLFGAVQPLIGSRVRHRQGADIGYIQCEAQVLIVALAHSATAYLDDAEQSPLTPDPHPEPTGDITAPSNPCPIHGLLLELVVSARIACFAWLSHRAVFLPHAQGHPDLVLRCAYEIEHLKDLAGNSLLAHERTQPPHHIERDGIVSRHGEAICLMHVLIHCSDPWGKGYLPRVATVSPIVQRISPETCQGISP